MKRMHVDELYTAYLEGSLPEARRREVDAHLRECPQCAAALDELRQLIVDLEAMPLLTPPTDVVAGVRARLDAPRRRTLGWWRPVFAGSSLAAAAAIWLLFFHFAPSPHDRIALGPQTVESRHPLDPSATGHPLQSKIEPSLPAPRYASAPKRSSVYRHTSPNSLADHNVPIKESSVSMGASQRNISAATTPTDTEKTDAMGRIVIALGSPPDSPAGEGTAMQSVKDTDVVGVYGEASNDSSFSDPALHDGFSGMDVQGDDVRTHQPAGWSLRPSPTMSEVMTGATDTNIQRNMGSTDSENILTYVLPFNGSKSADACGSSDTGNVQHTSVGTLGASVCGVQANSKKSQVLLHINARTDTSLHVQYSEERQQDRQVVLHERNAEVSLTLPQLPEGAALKLGLDGQQEHFYLIVPNNGPRIPRIDVRANNQPLVTLLRELANASGRYIMCPVEFGDRAVSYTAKNTTPAETFTQLVNQAGYQESSNGLLLNIVPSP